MLIALVLNFSFVLLSVDFTLNFISSCVQVPSLLYNFFFCLVLIEGLIRKKKQPNVALKNACIGTDKCFCFILFFLFCLGGREFNTDQTTDIRVL